MGRASDHELRLEIIAAARRMNALGINQGKSGNLSHRTSDGFLVTPTGIDYDELKPKQIVPMRFDGTYHGAVRPSSEWRFHCDILRERREVNAVLHAHSRFATTLACLSREIPPFHYMIAVAGGDSIRCAPYATFGTEELSRNAVAALAGRKACLLAHHGMIAVGSSLADALRLAVEVETLAEMYWRVLLIDKPVLLDGAEMARVIDKFSSYGQQPSQTDAAIDPAPTLG